MKKKIFAISEPPLIVAHYFCFNQLAIIFIYICKKKSKKNNLHNIKIQRDKYLKHIDSNIMFNMSRHTAGESKQQHNNKLCFCTNIKV